MRSRSRAPGVIFTGKPRAKSRKLSERFLTKEVVHNPVYRNESHTYMEMILATLRFKQTILPTIAPVLALVFCESVIVAVLFHVYGLPINLDDKMISWLGSAIAMLLAFRTNRSFERYNQGSQLWTNLATQIRNCSRLIWNSVTLRSEEGLVEKNSIMKLLLATAVATKHALRGADPYKFQDLRRLLPDDFITGGAVSPRLRRKSSGTLKNAPTPNNVSSLPSLFSSADDGLFLSVDSKTQVVGSAPASSTSSVLRPTKSMIPALPKKLSPLTMEPISMLDSQGSRTRHSISGTSGVLEREKVPASRYSHRRASVISLRSREFLRFGKPTVGNVINVPLDILHQINHYVRRQRHSGDVVQEDSSAVMNAISTAIDSVTKFEQILYFPVPTTYDVHIKHVMLLYFAFLPFQLVKSMGWAMILATFVMAITFFGIDAIAGEIAEPFGTDENDLPLDYFCHKLQDDIEYIMDQNFDVTSTDEEEDEAKEAERGRKQTAFESPLSYPNDVPQLPIAASEVRQRK